MNWPLHRSPLKSSTAATEASSNERVVVRGQRQNHQLHSLEVVPCKGGSSPRPSRRSRRPWTRCRRTSWDRSSVSSVCFSNNSSSRWRERHPKIAWLFFTLGELAHDLRSCILILNSGNIFSTSSVFGKQFNQIWRVATSQAFSAHPQAPREGDFSTMFPHRSAIGVDGRKKGV